MQRYKGESRGSGVIAFEVENGSIAVQFRDGAIYLYTVASAGERNIDAMKRLAASGEGLTTYISQQVKTRYAQKC